jgi:hypothetical protein
MPGTTATQKLTYPTSGDNLKDQALYLRTLGKQVDARVAANAAFLARQLNRPCAIIDCTIPNAININSNQLSIIKFDTVVVDTAGLVDLSSDQRIIKLTSTGYWLLGFYVDFQGTPGGSNCTSNGSITALLNCDNGTPNTWSNFVHDFNLTHSYVGGSGLTQITNPALPGNVYVQGTGTGLGTGCTGLLTAATARMWAFKVREL